ncbi:MAG TPA: flagellar assembly protein FliW [Polyangiaceae bacterium]|nr:flagellar assembly protein FliW [Polyangiaceae bacterium]
MTALSTESTRPITIKTLRFGELSLDPAEALRFPVGIAGFPDERGFVLIRPNDTALVSWLQSIKTPSLALPVVSAHAFGEGYPDVDLAPLAERAGVGSRAQDLAVLVVLTAPRGAPATVNLLAPIVVNAESRVGAQIFLEGTRFGTRELFVTGGSSEASPK